MTFRFTFAVSYIYIYIILQSKLNLVIKSVTKQIFVPQQSLFSGFDTL